jgi:alkaline phosphatase D
MSMFDMPLPLRSLRKRSDEKVQRNRTGIKTVWNGTKSMVTVIDELPRERVLKYIPGGNYKW